MNRPLPYQQPQQSSQLHQPLMSLPVAAMDFALRITPNAPVSHLFVTAELILTWLRKESRARD